MKALLALAIVIGSTSAFASAVSTSDDVGCVGNMVSSKNLVLCAQIENRLDGLCGLDQNVAVNKECKVELFSICKAQTSSLEQTKECVDGLNLN